MNQQIYCGKVGIKAVTRSLSQIDSANAKASKPQDEDRILSKHSKHFVHTFELLVFDFFGFVFSLTYLTSSRPNKTKKWGDIGLLPV